MTVKQTAGKTLEEIDYIFAKGEVRDRLAHQFEGGRRASIASASKAGNVEKSQHVDVSSAA